MSEIVGECTICGTDLMHNEEAYGITTGVMRKDMDGFISSDCTPWEEILCIECMDEVDRAFLEIRERLQRLRERSMT